MDFGDISWMLVSTALVVFMVPGLALFYSGMVLSKNVLDQAVAIGSVVVFSFAMTWVIVKVLDAVVGLRVDGETELAGLDQRIHAESAYNEGHKGSVVA
tara:strand:+ start:89 stop:385 length:297 start_codon:yes stop_codon:yes gene_type:complete